LLFGNKHPYLKIPILSYKVIKSKLEYLGYDGLTKTINLDLLENNPSKYLEKRTFYFGTRVSFLIGCIAVFISLFVGMSTGAVAGYCGGKIDTIIMWIINITWSEPLYY